MLSTLEPPKHLAPSTALTHVIRINALGGLSVVDATGSPISGAAAQPRRMAILAVLARAGQRRVTRDKLLALLWPDADDERGPRALTQALYALRKDLGDESAIDGAKELRLDPELITSDVADSAAVHYAWVAKAWSAADPMLAPRVNAARTRLAALKH
jgi:DNA-binding SARP family transcriptional activator